ncbi:Plant cysteine oxidase 2 [Camellia lanceoleosa]|uniref:Plant cysteine oxidase 2 n=1 Tax=Camellia lanceoleosa TaxID=1840588 RepID=A0ACC0FV12_9ERIC|nr:Plant cysteine oxidase 2 [Camellia lanceoleosa]
MSQVGTQNSSGRSKELNNARVKHEEKSDVYDFGVILLEIILGRSLNSRIEVDIVNQLCMFFLPATAVIPLHNHPGMTVFSKLLRGTMHIKAYDWVDPVNSDDSVQPSQPRLARLKADSVFTAPCDTSVLYPTSGGNIHAFTAITPCVVLDVMGPPYSKDDGRDCSYYRDIPYNALSNGEKNTVAKEGGGDSYGWLEEIEMPEDSQMDGIEYLGPPISEFTS